MDVLVKMAMPGPLVWVGNVDEVRVLEDGRLECWAASTQYAADRAVFSALPKTWMWWGDATTVEEQS